MVRLTIQIEEHVHEHLQQLARECGVGSVQKLVERMLTSNMSLDFGAPAHLTFGSQEELEGMLLERLNRPGESTVVTDESWAKFKQRLLETPPKRKGRKRA